jgi:hypothetical protein
MYIYIFVKADCHSPACLSDPEKIQKLSNFSAYNHRFRYPSPESDGILNMHYTFNYGPVHFINLDTETGYPGAPEEKSYVLPSGGFFYFLDSATRKNIHNNFYKKQD